MLAYQIRLALLSLRRNPVLSILMVVAIGMGIAVSTAFVGMYRVYSGNPIPDKGDRLFYVQLDSWDPEGPFDSDHPERPPHQLVYRDAIGVSSSGIPTLESPMFKSAVIVFSERQNARPELLRVRLCTADFFPMFDVPFRYGSGWDRHADRSAEQVVVIDDATNQKLFGGRDSVGDSLRVGDRIFTVVGVLAPWRPAPKFYDPHNGPNAEPEPLYMPFSLTPVMELYSHGNQWSWLDEVLLTHEDYLASEMVWIQMWVQLDDDDQRQSYHDHLDAYVMEQKKLGRYPRPLNNRLLDVQTWLQEEEVVPEHATGLVVISLLFLIVSAVNLVGLLLAKFLGRGPEIGVRRALGATRRSVFVQHVVECEVVGILGGTIGIALSVGVLAIVNRMLDTGGLFRLEPAMVLIGVGLALGAGLVAGIFPAWRVCRIAPATHLKMR